MNTKFTLAIIALIGIGVFALPSTMSLFSGQHTFYNIDATGNQVPCAKCHGDVKAELSSATAMAGSGAPHARVQCEYCHRAETGFAAGDDAYVEIRYQSQTNPTTAGRLSLITTISNFEAGNFPKVIEVLDTTINVSTWTTKGNIYQIDGTTPFVDIPTLRVDFDPLEQYDGVLGTTVTLGKYNYSRGSLTNLRASNGSLIGTRTDDLFELTSDVTCSAQATCTINATAGSNVMTPGQTYHAASLVSCMECHGGEQLKGAPGYEVEQSPFGLASTVVGRRRESM
jgi:cytochrome c553